jgi:hypothetical protein
VFYIPGSWYIGRCLEALIAHEYSPVDLEWDDNDRRGAGSILFVLGVLAGIGALIAYAGGALG